MFSTSLLMQCSPGDESQSSARCEGHFWFLTFGFAACILPLRLVGSYRGAHTCTTWALEGDGCPFKGNPGVETLNSVRARLLHGEGTVPFLTAPLGRSESGHFIEVIMMVHSAENVENILLIYSGF